MLKIHKPMIFYMFSNFFPRSTAIFRLPQDHGIGSTPFSLSLMELLPDDLATMILVGVPRLGRVGRAGWRGDILKEHMDKTCMI
jgi:hypothetical protein